MPVNFSEPLSMLQRLTEDFEYSDILDTAARYELHAFSLIHNYTFYLLAFKRRRLSVLIIQVEHIFVSIYKSKMN